MTALAHAILAGPRRDGVTWWMRAAALVACAWLLGASTASAASYSITIDGYEIASVWAGAEITSSVVVESRTKRRVAATVTLVRGLSDNRDIWTWHEAVIVGDIARRDMVLVAYDDEKREVGRYLLSRGYPSKVEISSLKAGASEVLLETVTLICESIQRVAP